MSILIVVVDDEPDIEMLFRQHFRRDLFLQVLVQNRGEYS